MTQEQALRFIEINKINLDKYKSVIVTSDNAVYCDSELAPIKLHCEAHNKTYFVVKSEKKEAEAPKKIEEPLVPFVEDEPKVEAKEAKPKKKK